VIAGAPSRTGISRRGPAGSPATSPRWASSRATGWPCTWNNAVDAVEANLAAERAGAIAVPINPQAAAAEVEAALTADPRPDRADRRIARTGSGKVPRHQLPTAAAAG
jgi:hypothetical protein